MKRFAFWSQCGGAPDQAVRPVSFIKTSASHRTIPLPQIVVTALSEHVRQFPVTHPDGLLFTDDDGEALRRTAFSARSGDRR
jgi:hypothetical protein